MKDKLTLNKDKTKVAMLNKKENFMKHILKTTAIGGMSMLCCFVLEAMDIDPNGSDISEKISNPAGGNLRQVSELNFFDQHIGSMTELKEKLVGIDLNSVQTLILSQNPITTLEGFPEFPNLQRLYMVGCQLQSLKGCPNLPALRVLSLENNQIRDLRGLENVSPDLEELYLSNNKIRSIFNKLNFIRLKKLDLSCNQLEKVLGDLVFSTDLERLNLSNNQLRGFRYESWNNLKSLNLSNNRLESRNFGREFGSCENLIELDLSNNQLVCDKYYPVRLLLPSSVDNLERLQLEGNRIPEEEIIKESREMPNCNISFQDNEGHRKAAFGGNITILDAPGAQ